jgi:hypothetical protein
MVRKDGSGSFAKKASPQAQDFTMSKKGLPEALMFTQNCLFQWGYLLRNACRMWF